VRTAYNSVTGKELADVEFKPARGLEGIKEAEVDFGGGKKIRIAVAHQMGNIATVLDSKRKKKKEGREVPYHFVEVMACRGGCIAGGGQPYGATDEVRLKRTAGIYSDDKKSKYRCSHQNPFISQVYKDFLGEPNGHKAHELLHTGYESRQLYLK
jgi:NADH-quinone oxidoreductase subunit G